MDPISGEERFTYGTLTLRDGFGLVPVAMGLFGIAEVLENLIVLGKQSVYETKIQGLLPNRQDWRDSAAPMARGSVLGFFLGILPGPGPVIASFVSYAMEKRLSRYPEKFGKEQGVSNIHWHQFQYHPVRCCKAYKSSKES